MPARSWKRPWDQRSQQLSDHTGTRVEGELLLPLDEEAVAQGLTEPAAEGGGVESVVDLDVDRPRAEPSAQQEEGECDGSTGGDDDIRPKPAQYTRGQTGVAHQVADCLLSTSDAADEEDS